MQKIDLYNFLNYYYVLLNTSIKEKQGITTSFSYENGYLSFTNNTENCFSKNNLKCSEEKAVEIINELYKHLIERYEMSITSIKKEGTSCELHIEDTKSMNNNSDYQKSANMFKLYKSFVEHNSMDTHFDIYPYYFNNKFSIKIVNNNNIVFSYKINCSKERARKLTKIITEHFIDSRDIVISAINDYIHYPFYQNLNEKITRACKICNHSCDLIIPNYNNEELLDKLHEQAINKINNKILTISYNSTK